MWTSIWSAKSRLRETNVSRCTPMSSILDLQRQTSMKADTREYVVMHNEYADKPSFVRYAETWRKWGALRNYGCRFADNVGVFTRFRRKNLKGVLAYRCKVFVSCISQMNATAMSCQDSGATCLRVRAHTQGSMKAAPSFPCFGNIRCPWITRAAGIRIPAWTWMWLALQCNRQRRNTACIENTHRRYCGDGAGNESASILRAWKVVIGARHSA